MIDEHHPTLSRTEKMESDNEITLPENNKVVPVGMCKKRVIQKL